MKLTYQQALEAVKGFVAEENGLYYLVQAFAETNDQTQAEKITAEMYQQASEGVNDFEMTVQEYLIAMVDQQEKLVAPDTFENEDDANYNGHYWIDDLNAWIKLDF